MREEERNPNSTIDIPPDLLEEIFLILPSKTILRFKTVSKLWRSILDSKTFVEKRLSLQTNHKILGRRHTDQSLPPEPGSGEDKDEDIFYLLHCEDVPRLSMTCDGLVCIPEPGWVNILNPTTRKLRRFPSRPDQVSSRSKIAKPLLTCAMGFGRDKVTRSYKVVRMCFHPVGEYDVLDIETGVWRKMMSPSPYKVDVDRKSVYVNGSIYWLSFSSPIKLLALDLHTEEFRDVSIPAEWVTRETELVNLEDRLAFSKTSKVGFGHDTEWLLDIWSMNTYQEQWSKTYSISLACLAFNPGDSNLFTPLTVSKLGNVVFWDNHRRLFKYYGDTHEIRCLSSNIHVISAYLENLVTLWPESGHHRDMEHLDHKSKFLKSFKSFLKICVCFL